MTWYQREGSRLLVTTEDVNIGATNAACLDFYQNRIFGNLRLVKILYLNLIRFRYHRGFGQSLTPLFDCVSDINTVSENRGASRNSLKPKP